MKKKIILFSSVILLIVIVYFAGNPEKGEGTYPPCIYVSDAVYFSDGEISLLDYGGISENYLSYVGVTEEVRKLPEKQGEVMHVESGYEIVYDSLNDCVYVYDKENFYNGEDTCYVFRKMD